MKFKKAMLAGLLCASSLMPQSALVFAADEADGIRPDLPAELAADYTYYEELSDEFNGTLNDMWLMDYMPWWSDTAKREKSGTRTRSRFIDADGADNQSLQIYVNGENDMNAENFQPYYLEKLSGPRNQPVADRYLWSNTSQKNNWNSKFAGFMAGGKDYLNTFRGAEAPIENHQTYSDAGATQYGYFETRCKFLSQNKGEGLAPAFWFIGMQDDAVDRGEVDVFEFLDNYTLDFTIHPKGDPRMTYATKEFRFDEDMSKDYHTYGLLWDETGFSLYVDGEFLWKHNIQINYRMIPMFSINHHENGWIGSVDGKNHPEERTFDIDYYRVFKKNGTDWQIGQPDLPEMQEGRNMSDAAYISLFGLSGTEWDATPADYLNDNDLTTTMLSGRKTRTGENMEQAELPQMLYIDWRKPAKFNTIVMHAQNAKSMAPTLVDVQISDDGENWRTIKEDVRLNWQSDSAVAESKTITLDQTVENNLHTRLVIKEANMTQGKFGVTEIEVGENITASEPDYLPLPAPEELDIKSNLFASWQLDDVYTAHKAGLDITYDEGQAPAFENGKDGHDKALKLRGLNTRVYAPLKTADQSEQLKSDEDFTLSMWVKPESVNAGSDQIILAQQTGTNGGRPWLFMYQGKVGSYLGIENNYANTNIPANEWTHLAVTQKVTDASAKKATMTLYQNGVKVGGKNITMEADDRCDPRLLLGRHKAGNKGGYTGLMDDVTLFTSALSEAEIAALFEADGKIDDVNEAGTIYNVSSVSAIDGFKGIAGETSLDDVILPENVSAIFDNTYVKEVPVKWNEEALAAIDFAQPGTYTVDGVLDLSAVPNASNTEGVKASFEVVLKEKVSLEGVRALLDRVNAVKAEDYTPESFASFLEACQNVQTKNIMLMIGTYPNYTVTETIPEIATPEMVKRMEDELTAAFDRLVEADAKIDVTLLTWLIGHIEKADLSAYIENAALQTLNTTLSEAKDAADHPQDQQSVNASVSSLNHSWMSVRLKPNETLLEEFAAKRK